MEENGGIELVLTSRIKCGWMKWREVKGVL